MDRAFLHVMSGFNGLLVAFVFHVIVLAQGQIASCVPEMKIRKNMLCTASSESKLNISCPVTYCEEIPAVGWIKIDNKNNFIHISGTNQVTITQEQTGLKDITSHMIFRNISTDDNGIYRCMISASNFSLESHNINVNVSGRTLETADRIPIMVNVPQLSWLPYSFMCLGILLLLMTMTLTSSLSKCRCVCPTKTALHKTEYTTAVYTLTTSSPAISTCDA
ncbi:hypothetical protein PHYPO_G00208820 [Pangasianodon hypophthalmus]|uniref:Ig-like domain-containing protein n=1 Tax=Pangasianodon hypophthalmus TaxID=310915 RepID=A0A5N5PDI3_PANHP|nr:hypothetical protein PHYPO_G00208820 [Pangasianodon hypophthalmus]